jgi:endonuclease YncB( thermonuclease family)
VFIEEMSNMSTKKCYNYQVDVISVYDGDTITVNVDLGFSMALNKLKIRLTGVDTAEMKSTDEALKKKAIAARDFIREQILNKRVLLECYGQDKYGRWLGKIFAPDGTCLNEELIKRGFAYAYDGGTKDVTQLEK